MKLFKKLAFLGLAVVAGVSIAGCENKENDGGGVTPPPVGPVDPVDPVGPSYSNDGTHTYNQATSTFPNNFNPFTYQTATANSLVLSYTSSGFYEFDYNEDKTGYELVNGMAVADPEDVTAEYKGADKVWGIGDTDVSRAWRIKIRDDLKFDDGTAITAETFVESMKLLLAPAAQNYRADSAYSGNFVIHNAQKYLYQGKEGVYAADIANDPYDSTQDSEYVFKLGPATKEEPDAEASIRAAIGFPATYDANMVASYLIANYIGGAVKDQYGEDAGTEYPALDADGKSALLATFATMEGKTLAQIKADPTMSAAWNRLIAWWQTMADEELDFLVADYTWPEVKWEDVGIKVVDDYTIDYIIDKPLSGFYLKYSIPTFLVNIELYNKCASTSGGVYSNSYGTSVETYSSYGPYKLTTFQMDKELVLSRNENWYGYNDQEPGEGYYQTDVIRTVHQVNDATRLQMFLNGELDGYGLTEADMQTYSSSPYTYYATGASTFFIAINPTGETTGDKALETLEFRQALSFAVDRKAFALACSPMNNAGLALFSNLIVSDPEQGLTYRAEEVAKDVILEFWGLADQVGEGKRYATKEEAIASITGVDTAQAKVKFNEAAQKLKDSGAWDGSSKIEIIIGAPSNASFYSKGFDVLTNSWNEAAKGTAFEDKFTFTFDYSIGDGFGDALRQGQVDILFGVGWSGSELDPYGLIGAYTDPSYTYDTGIDYDTVMVPVTFESIEAYDADRDGNAIDGTKQTLTNVTLTASALAWSNEGLSGNVVVTDENNKTYVINCGPDQTYENRIAVLAACEGAVLEQYTMLPLLDDSSAQMKGHKINYATEEYVFGMGFGGMKYYTYNYDDEGWADYVADQGGTLDYIN